MNSTSPTYAVNPATACPDPQAARLVATAYDTIRRRYVEGRHQIGAAIIAADGKVYLGIHVEAMVGRFSVCAEMAALAAARLCTNQPLLAVAAVRYPKPSEAGGARIVSPCGGCREVLLDHAPQIQAVVPQGEQGVFAPLHTILPIKYVGTKWGAQLPIQAP
ncbi:hypothetical protein [Kitasatospora aureofaciens]|uniref:hypothetical protein n=1 Tax=Kitasatospora aureofaciens TaxID=1894 RepID=UPI001C444398|nr:hypothetical protein [Kitasatospora aureofaciens]MBV6701379.1 hypothetical protein [Kitasatospora aureofaciens]